MLHLLQHKALTCTKVFSRLKHVATFEAQYPDVVKPRRQELEFRHALSDEPIPEPYVRMMRHTIHRLPKTMNSRYFMVKWGVQPNVMSRRMNKYSFASRVATPSGRDLLLRKMIAGQKCLWTCEK